ncbi:MAG: hypothetical protein AAFR63_13080 [Cyanobacteria bacterium J06631_6]
MSLEPCQVCGTLNAEGTEICLSCGHPTKGNKRPVIFRWIAIALVVCFALPFLSGVVQWILLQFRQESPTIEPTISLQEVSDDLK